MEFEVEIAFDDGKINSKIIRSGKFNKGEEYYFDLYYEGKSLIKTGWIRADHYSFKSISSGNYQVQAHIKFEEGNFWKRSKTIEVGNNKNILDYQPYKFSPLLYNLEDFNSDDDLFEKQIHLKTKSQLCDLDAFLYLRENAEGTLVVFPAVQRVGSEKNPIFHRWSWYAQFPNYNFIAISDPSLNLFDVPGGWFLSGSEVDFISEIADFLSSIFKKIQIKSQKKLFYGSSMGGFGAMMVASEMPFVSVLAEVPQTDLRNYSIKSAVRMIENKVFKGVKLTNLDKSLCKMISVSDRFKENSTIPRTKIITNPTDEGFEQCIDFLKDVVSISPSIILRNKITLDILPDDLGHNPLDSSILIPLIHDFMSELQIKEKKN